MKNKMKYTIFCDLDGVLVDFNKGYKDLTGIDINGKFLSDEGFWSPIHNAGADFWINLRWKSDGKKLWDRIKLHDPIILSSPSRDKTSYIGKRIWVSRELPGTKLILKSAKYKKIFANKNTILIDDRLENIDDWKSAGGIAIHHKSAHETIKELELLNI